MLFISDWNTSFVGTTVLIHNIQQMRKLSKRHFSFQTYYLCGITDNGLSVGGYVENLSWPLQYCQCESSRFLIPISEKSSKVVFYFIRVIWSKISMTRYLKNIRY